MAKDGAALAPKTSKSDHFDLAPMFEQTNCLNEATSFPHTNCLKDATGLLESDADEQILLRINFKSAVKVAELQMGCPEGETMPSRLRIFINTTDLGFDEVSVLSVCRCLFVIVMILFRQKSVVDGRFFIFYFFYFISFLFFLFLTPSPYSVIYKGGRLERNARFGIDGSTINGRGRSNQTKLCEVSICLQHDYFYS